MTSTPAGPHEFLGPSSSNPMETKSAPTRRIDSSADNTVWAQESTSTGRRRKTSGDTGVEKNQQQEAPQGRSEMSAADKEIPDMVPLLIRHELPEFQHQALHNVLAGLLLTWKEFFCLFDIHLDPKKYVLFGVNGEKLDLDALIGAYVETFKRKQKIYSVELKRVNEENEAEKAQNPQKKSMMAPNTSSSTVNNYLSSTGRASLSRPSAAKKLRLIDEERRRDINASIEDIAQNVIESPHNSKRLLPIKKDLKRGSIGSRSDTFVRHYQVEGSNPTNIASAQQGPRTGAYETGRVKRFSLDARRESRETLASKPGRRGRKPKCKPAAENVRSSRSTRDTDSSIETSDEDEDENPTKEQKKLLKKFVLKYLREKVSPRSFLRIRSELTALREQEKYFKVTSLLPMTAGMMEQAFCRKVND